MEYQVVNNEAENRFEVVVEGQTAVAEYSLFEGGIIFSHTEVPEALEGRGIASALARTALEYAKAKGWKVVPLCPYFKGYIDKHAEYQSISTLHGGK